MPNTVKEDLQRMLALKALREQIYLQHPVAHGATDFIEDIPQMNPYGMLGHDILPSMALMKHNDQDRQMQIEQAKNKVRNLQHSDKGLFRESLESGGKMLGAALPFITAFSLGPKLLNPAIRKNLMQPQVRSKLWGGLKEHLLEGGAMAAGTGMAAPLLTHQLNPSDQTLNEAGDILQKHPYSSSIPFADTIMASQYGRPQSYTRDAAVGAATGGATVAGLLGMKNLARKGISMYRGTPYKGIGLKLPGLAGIVGGAGVGALSSYLNRNADNPQR